MDTKHSRTKFLSLFVLPFLICVVSAKAQTPWVTVYYAGWSQGWADNGYLPTKDVDFTAMTVVAHMSLSLNASGGLDSVGNTITQKNSSDLIAAAHAVGTKVIITIGGWATESRYMSSTSPAYFNTFVNHIVDFVKDRGYDGVDIDWEPLTPADTTNYMKLIIALRNDLPSPRYLLTSTAGEGQPYAVFAYAQHYLDQINIMTYDLSWNGPGTLTWYNGAVYTNGVRYQSTHAPVPSCNNIVQKFIAAGVAPSKLGIGSELAGFIWKGGVMIVGAGDTTTTGNGATGPDQEWEGYLDHQGSPFKPTVTPDVPLYSFYGGPSIMNDYYKPDRYHWDAGAEAAYLSINNPGSENDYFISYDDTNSIAAKFALIRKEHLGGIILYELGMAYPGNGTFPLLASLKRDMEAAAPSVPPDSLAPSVSISSPTNGDTVSGTIVVYAKASGKSPITGVTFKIDNNQIGSIILSAPFFVKLNTLFLSNGPHTISATAIDASGNTATTAITAFFSNLVPEDISLQQNYPNPFNPSTEISFSNVKPGYVILKVYNVLGQRVVTLVDGYMPAGYHSVVWDAGRYPSGTYIYRLVIGSRAVTRKMLLLK